MPDKQELHQLIDQLPESELPSGGPAISSFSSPRKRRLIPEMLARIDDARANRSTGIPHDDIVREYRS